MLKVENLNVHYGSTQILWNVSLQVAPGEIAAIMGPNGSGKSTILKAIIGLVKASSGAVTLDGETLLGVPTHEMLARRGMKARELAATVGISETQLSLFRSGKVKGIRFRTLAKLCAVLECAPGDLLDYDYVAADLQEADDDA